MFDLGISNDKAVVRMRLVPEGQCIGHPPSPPINKNLNNRWAAYLIHILTAQQKSVIILIH